MSRDPVCGREVDGLRARAVGIWGGRTFYFCSPEHRDAFAKDPSAYRDGAASGPVPLAAMQQSGRVAAPAPALPSGSSGSSASARASSPAPDAGATELPEGIPRRLDRTASGGTSAPPAVPRQDSGPLAPARSSGLLYFVLALALLFVGLIGFLATRP